MEQCSAATIPGLAKAMLGVPWNSRTSPGRSSRARSRFQSCPHARTHEKVTDNLIHRGWLYLPPGFRIVWVYVDSDEPFNVHVRAGVAFVLDQTEG